MNAPMRTLCAVLTTVALTGCVGTAMTTDPDTGATVPVKGWRQGPWWYGDPAWQFLTVGQGGRPDLSRPSAAMERPVEATPAAVPPAEATEKPASN